MKIENIDKDTATVLNGILNVSTGHEIYAIILGDGAITIRSNQSPSPYLNIKLKSIKEILVEAGHLSERIIENLCIKEASWVVQTLRRQLKTETEINNAKEKIKSVLRSNNMLSLAISASDCPTATSVTTIKLDPCWDVSPGSICCKGGAGCPLPHEDDWRSIKSSDPLEWRWSVNTLSFDPKKIGIQFPHNASKRQLKQFMKKLRKIDKQFLKIRHLS